MSGCGNQPVVNGTTLTRITCVAHPDAEINLCALNAHHLVLVTCVLFY